MAESRLLAGLRDELTTPKRFEQFKREVRRLLDAERNSLRDQDRECQRRSNSDPPFGLNAEVKLTHLGP